MHVDILVAIIARAIVLDELGAAAWVVLSREVSTATREVIDEPEKHVPLPRCRKSAIALAPDDGQIFALELKQESATGRINKASATLSLSKGKKSNYTLRGVDRINSMLSRGMRVARGTITRKTPDGGLCLHLPFIPREPGVDGSHEGVRGASAGSKDGKDTIMVAGCDLGLKHLAWLSIDECNGERNADGSMARIEPGRGDLARHCIDEPQLAGSKDSWLEPPFPASFFRFKQKLSRLTHHARCLQARVGNLKASRPGRYKRLRRYFKLRREWKRIWNRIRNLHGEMTRQLATRLVEACKHHVVALLRIEDLSWSTHSSRDAIGSWLSSRQVHGFHGQIQARVVQLSAQAGIAVEWVDARNTSKRCSRCGIIGKRKGKTFTCSDPACGLRLDSDLNAARNIMVAGLSPRLYAKGTGSRYNPVASPVRVGSNSDEKGSDVQHRPCLK
ncbi:MAG: zinc ribbon domain-containing protein [Promethearchaeota archaeon]